ncbi:MAG: hypothetical protein K2P46_03505 [Alistipes sp.]|nr:hypothetical protein [Alistipes sp.]
MKAVFFISGRISRNDFRIFDSAPAASRRDKTSITKLNPGFGPKIRRVLQGFDGKRNPPANDLQADFSQQSGNENAYRGSGIDV